jgi:hypothetical protein
MTGPEHYVLAEKLLTEATQARGEAARARRIAIAQVHATLAAAAATALGGSDLEPAAWRDAAGTTTAIPGES